MPKKQAKIHVIAHTHWDREWYFTKQDSDVLATYNFTHVIETLENTPEYTCYHLDGQTSIVEDYLAILPNMKSRLVDLITQKRLFIGPWYTQTDTYNVSGESIIRNLKYGIHLAEELGYCMKIGYLPDTFGHNAQIPTLFSHCGIDNIIFWRGLDYEKHTPTSHFIWQAPSGKSIYAYHLVYGYGAAKNIKADDVHLNNKIFPMVENIKSRVRFDQVLLPSGGDQVNLDPNLPEILKIASQKSPAQDHYFISSMEAYIEVLKQRTEQTESENPTYQGEFKTPRYTRIHKTIGSVRYDIKKLNEEIEQFILVKLEPLVAFAKKRGITVHTEVLDRAWKLILESHAHDSMGGCNSDATNQDVLHRLKQAKQLVEALYNLVVKELAVRYEDKQLLVFNSQLTPFSGGVKATLFSERESIRILKKSEGDEEFTENIYFEYLSTERINGGKVIEVTKSGEKEVPVADYFKHEIVLDVTDLPALGYVVYHLENQAISSNPQPIQSDMEQGLEKQSRDILGQFIDAQYVPDNHIPEQCAQEHAIQRASKIENEVLSLIFEDHNLVLFNKLTRCSTSLMLCLEDQADDGDSYDFSPLTDDAPFYFDKWECVGIKTSHRDSTATAESMHQTLTIKTAVLLPSDLNQRITLLENQSSTPSLVSNPLVKSEVEIQLTLVKGNPQLLVKLNHANRVCDHRLRLVINSGIKTSTIYNSMPFALMKRTYEEPPLDWKQSYREYPINIETTDSFVALQDDIANEKSFQLILRGLKEFQMLPSKKDSTEAAKIAITLFKSVGVLGKDDLDWRPGRASGINNTKVFTPDAQLLSAMEFDFAISLPQVFSHESLRVEEQRYLRSPFVYQKQTLNTFQHRLERFQLNFGHWGASNLNGGINHQSLLHNQFCLLEQINTVFAPPMFISSIGHSFSDKNTVLLRVFNAGTETVELDLNHLADLVITRVNFCETPEVQEFSVLPNDAIVLKIQLR